MSLFLPFYLPRLYLYFHETNGHHTWQAGELGERPPTTMSRNLLVIWSCDGVTNSKCYISSSSISVTKLDMELGSNERMLSKKSHDSLITWTH